MPFQKGQSGNPGGRAKAKHDIRALAQDAGPEAIETLKTIMVDTKAAPSARTAAACALLDRGYGRPDQHSTLDVTKHDHNDWTRNELVAILDDARARSRRAATANGRGEQSDKIH